MKYEKNKGYYVGTFNSADIMEKLDKKAVEEAKEKHNLKYTNTELVKKRNEIVGIKIWVCKAEDMKI